MCQPKSQGGKRCAIHHHGTQAAVQTTTVKTGVDINDVKDVFSELNKEGKKLPSPSRSEYESYIEKERFMTEIDATLSDRDRKMILKKLEKAKEENTPSGGTFHAWKNLMSATLQKFKTKTKLFIAGLGVAAITFGTAGCAGIMPNNGALQGGAGTSISIVQGQQITDELGSYTKVSIDPNDPLLSPEARQYREDEQPLYDAGFTEEDINNAQRAAVTFASTEMIDNTSVDLPGNKEQNLSQLAGQYFTGDYADDMSLPESNVIYTAPAGIVLVRDGSSRIVSNSSKRVLASLNQGAGGGLIIEGENEVTYRVVPNEASKNKSTLSVIVAWAYKMQPDANGQWKIAGYSNEYTSNVK